MKRLATAAATSTIYKHTRPPPSSEATPSSIPSRFQYNNTSNPTTRRHSSNMSHSLKQKGAAHRSNHPKGTTAKQYNVNRRLYPYPDPDDDESAPGTIRVHSIEGLNPRDRILESWTRCEKPKGSRGGTCLSGHSGFYVRLGNGKLKAAIKLYGATCEHEGQGGVEDDEEGEEGGEEEGGEEEGQKGVGGQGDGEKNREGASSGAAVGGAVVS